MADNFLEKQREDYEKRKALWQKRKGYITALRPRNVERPEDEAL